MGSKKSLDERIAKLKKRQEQLRAQERILRSKQTESERKKHNKCLFELAKAIELTLKNSMGQNYVIDTEDLAVLIEFLSSQEINKKLLSKALKKDEKYSEQPSIVIDDFDF